MKFLRRVIARASALRPTPLGAPLQWPSALAARALVHRETFFELQTAARCELAAARAALADSDTEENQRRFALALFAFDRLHGALPFVSAGAADEEV